MHRVWLQELKPTDERCLTQLGGLVLYDADAGRVLYEWRDSGICDTADFGDVLKALPPPTVTG